MLFSHPCLPYEHVADAREYRILPLRSPMEQLRSKAEVSDNVPQLRKERLSVVGVRRVVRNFTNRWSKSEKEGIKEVPPAKVDSCILHVHPDPRLRIFNFDFIDAPAAAISSLLNFAAANAGLSKLFFLNLLQLCRCLRHLLQS